MTEIDVDMIAHEALTAARTLGCASPDQLARHEGWLIEMQDEIARALEKSRKANERKAA